MKIQLIHPIWHGPVEYDRGLHDLADDLAWKFLLECPHAARLPRNGALPGKTSPTPGAESARIDRLVNKRNAGF
jgi:hypothetical protein